MDLDHIATVVDQIKISIQRVNGTDLDDITTVVDQIKIEEQGRWHDYAPSGRVKPWP